MPQSQVGPNKVYDIAQTQTVPSSKVAFNNAIDTNKIIEELKSFLQPQIERLENLVNTNWQKISELYELYLSPDEEDLDVESPNEITNNNG